MHMESVGENIFATLSPYHVGLVIMSTSMCSMHYAFSICPYHNDLAHCC